MKRGIIGDKLVDVEFEFGVSENGFEDFAVGVVEVGGNIVDVLLDELDFVFVLFGEFVVFLLNCLPFLVVQLLYFLPLYFYHFYYLFHLLCRLEVVLLCELVLELVQNQQFRLKVVVHDERIAADHVWEDVAGVGCPMHHNLR